MWPLTLSDALRILADEGLVYPSRFGRVKVAPRAKELVPWFNWRWLVEIVERYVLPDPDRGRPWIDWDRVAVDVAVADPDAVG